MSGSTARSELGARLSETLQAYFEMKAASSLYRTAIDGTQLRARDILFKGLNQSSLNIFAGKRTVTDLIERVALFCNNGELAYSSFLSQISHLEGFMGAVLRSKGESDSGTLGKLQNRMLSFCVDASSDDVKSLDEVRERRNCLIHHRGNANQKYIDT